MRALQRVAEWIILRCNWGSRGGARSRGRGKRRREVFGRAPSELGFVQKQICLGMHSRSSWKRLTDLQAGDHSFRGTSERLVEAKRKVEGVKGQLLEMGGDEVTFRGTRIRHWELSMGGRPDFARCKGPRRDERPNEGRASLRHRPCSLARWPARSNGFATSSIAPLPRTRIPSQCCSDGQRLRRVARLPKSAAWRVL